MKNIFKFLSIVVLLNVAVHQSVYAQKKSKKSKTESVKEDKSAYQKLTEAKKLIGTGLFNVFKEEDKHYFELNESLLEREFLIVSKISGFVEGLKFGGAGMNPGEEYVIRWDRVGNHLLLRAVSFHNIANEELPIATSVRYNNFQPVLESFEIKAFSTDSTSFIVDVTNFFTSDIPLISPLDDEDRKNFKIKGLDKGRSLITGVKTFPQNIEVRHILTYNGDNLPANQPTGTLSVEMNQSIVLLPEEPMMPRYYDDRVGYFSSEIIDYGAETQRAQNKRIIRRWRLEPKDWDAYNRGELVEPVKPIIYYIDPATPEKFRKYFKLGIEDWQSAFEKIGFKNAILRRPRRLAWR